MKLLCIEQYNDIRFTLNEGDTTERVPFLTNEEKSQLLKDYPQKFKFLKDKQEELTIEFKEPTIEKREVKLTKKSKK